MKRANEFDDRETLTIPTNHIMAIVDGPEEAREIVESLNQHGFAPDDIGILAGMEDAGKLDAAAGEKGLFAKLLTSGVEIGDRDTDYIKRYRRAVLNGRTVVAVMAKSDAARKKAAHLLKFRGARFITFFGQLVTQVLEA